MIAHAQAYNTQEQAIAVSLMPGVQRIVNVARSYLRTEYDTRWHISSGSGYAHLSIMGNTDNSPDALGSFSIDQWSLAWIGRDCYGVQR